MFRYNFELHTAEESGSRAGEASKRKGISGSAILVIR
jgi:hypothetical protein